MRKINPVFASLSLIFFIAGLTNIFYLKNTAPIGGYFTDFFAIGLLYSLAKTFRPFNPAPLAATVFFIAILIEILRFYNFIWSLFITKSTAVIVGSTFDWTDIIIYGVSAAAIAGIDHFYNQSKKQR